MEINRDVRAIISSSSTDLPKALSTYLADERVSGSVTDDHNDDVDAERERRRAGEGAQVLARATAKLEDRLSSEVRRLPQQPAREHHSRRPEAAARLARIERSRG